ncbi:hypothetical protein ACFWBF_04350 [Streptomyces sp. NPDC060028]|uniref:hypothetical protein n=1 Tax=Streptomyces sp. NPDC060028 TaxID=3347041 RepID=UPI0036C9FF00
MSRRAQVLVLARYEDEAMAPLTRYDESRSWRGRLEQIPDGSLWRTDVGHTWLPEQTPEELRNPRRAW